MKNRNFLVVGIALFFASLLIAPSKAKAAGEKEGVLTVCIADSSGAAVSGATLTVSGPVAASKMTGSDGCASGKIPLGMYNAVATKSGVTITGMIDFNKDGQVVRYTHQTKKTPTPTAAPARTGALTICIADASGTAISGAKIQISGPQTASKTTDASGCVSGNVLFGLYSASASKGGANVSGTINFTQDGQVVRYTYKAASTPAPTAAPAKEGTLNICITDGAMAPVSGVSIKIAGPVSATKTTDGSGCVSGVVPFGSYAATATKLGVTVSGNIEFKTDGQMVKYAHVAKKEQAPVTPPPTAQPVAAGTLTICLSDPSGSPISGATIKVAGPITAQQTTLANGCASGRGPFGSYGAVATKDGRSVTGQFDFTQDGQVLRYTIQPAMVVQGTPQPVPPTPAPSGTLTICLADTKGVAIAGATIQVAGPISASRMTDASGCASGTGPFGRYGATASKDGRSVSGQFEFTQDGQVLRYTITAAMTSGGTPPAPTAPPATPTPTAPPTPQPATSGRLTVCITLGGVAVPGVTISVSGPASATQTTDGSGCTSGNAPFGNYSATASKDGKSVSGSINHDRDGTMVVYEAGP